MWKNLKYYMSLMLMCIGCVLPMAIFNLPEEAMSGAGALVVFFAGGGLAYSLFKMYFEEYQGEMYETDERLANVLSLIFSIISVGLNILVMSLYKESSLFGILNFLNEFSGDVGEFYLRLVTVIFSGLSLFPLFLMSVESIDTAIYDWKRTTYINGKPVKSEIVSHSCNESKAAYFFTTVLVGMTAVVGTSLSVAIIVLGLNIGSFINGKAKKIPQIIGVIGALAVTAVAILGTLRTTAIVNLDITVAGQLMPIVFAGLVVLFFTIYFKVEFLGRVLPLILAVFLMIFASWIVSFFAAKLVNVIYFALANPVPIV